MFFAPLAILFIVSFFFLLMGFFVLVQINLITVAFTEIGVPSQYVFTALLGTLLGSFVNIPVKRIPQDVMVTERTVRFFGFRYTVPGWEKKETILALNVGGAVIPIILSAYLLFKTGLWGKAVLATGIMTYVTFHMARPIQGVGIALPAFIPPLLAALLAVVIAYRHAPVIAYISGTMGTLIGADILHLREIERLGAPVASIGGAGTFDGIFLNGILAVLLAALIT
jgi:uncharacterized membrane protein